MTYQPGKRVMFKIKHVRTADCVVAGLSLAQAGAERARRLAAARPLRRGGHAPPRRRDVVVHDGRPAEARRGARAARKNALAKHPWREWANAGRREHAHARRSEPLEPGQGSLLGAAPHRASCEVKYDHLQGSRFRHAATFVRWRPTSSPRTAATISSTSLRPGARRDLGTT
jgi:ATP-dependent DNA ligase